MSRIQMFRSGVLSALSVVLCATGSLASAADCAPSATVDLSISADQPTIAPGHTGTQTVRVSNSGETTTGESLVAFVTPAYTNIDREVPLPAGCTLHYQNQDPTVPEVVNCRIPAGLAADRPVQLAIPLAVTERARLTGQLLDSLSVVPALESPDVEANMNDNWTTTSITVTRPTPAAPAGNRVGLYMAADVPFLEKDQTASAKVTYGNTGPAAMTDPVQITLVTPFTVNVDRTVALPAGCRIVLADQGLASPEIIVCTLPALGVDEQRTLVVPLRALGGGLTGRTSGTALIAPAGSDIETDQTDNLGLLSVKIPYRG
ncbi:hypothetical protein [Kitasatospora purpeofusca]|uniref:Repeat protein (TIGR01451 family) n=1 Tax=Kitasatospora purpeofusca TaxID=67352 RepID=A0ABZ1U8G6_9ACTN|nr:hypothetical protein [Kitasatospora purpeofusca]